ncbi:choline transporter-like protein 1 [Salvelinus fontinalis]|uniref:choline transporter-like protein 1 n=1 Tax=Salvelinus fontinalis TaxID=8038 RepID=UPI002485B8E4|nr:choline transporter-like protein 1 [Salvelinus fontinalis]
MLKACICCFCYTKKCLTYLNQNAYTATGFNITSFCTSTCDAFVLLVENALSVATINTATPILDYQVLIVSCTAFAGLLSLNYQRDYTVWVLPLLIVCLFSWLVAHCFLSVFEIVVDVLFLCFAVDTKHNDGSPGREFYMDKALMGFVENSKNMAGRDRPEADEDGGEMKPTGLQYFWNKSHLPLTLILSSMLRLAHYNLGNVAKGSFIRTLVEIPGLILTYIHHQLKGKVCVLSKSLS